MEAFEQATVTTDLPTVSTSGSREAAEAKWRRLIEEQKGSGLPIKRFCRSRGVNESSFFSWRKRLRGEAAGGDSPAFVRVDAGPVPPGDDVGPAIELQLRNDDRVGGSGGLMPVLILQPGFNTALLREVLAAVQERRS